MHRDDSDDVQAVLGALRQGEYTWHADDCIRGDPTMGTVSTFRIRTSHDSTDRGGKARLRRRM